MYSVAYVIRPRTKDESACLCFTLMSKAPSKKPWKRDPDVRTRLVLSGRFKSNSRNSRASCLCNDAWMLNAVEVQAAHP